jgi:hypothetical protein
MIAALQPRPSDGEPKVIEADDRGEEFMKAVGLSRRTRKPGRKGSPTCADCFFHSRLLCALDLESPCSTFRPDGPEGLVPPRQPALLLRAGEPAELAGVA